MIRAMRRLPLAVLLLLLGVSALAQEPTPAAAPAASTPAATAPETGRALARRYFELLSGGDLEKLDEVFAPDFIDRTPGNPTQVRGPASVRETQTRARGLFADVTYKVDEILAEGDRVAARYTVRARHKASGRTVEVTGASFFRVAEGKVREGWIVNDQIELYRQLGYTLAPPRTGAPAPTPAPTPPPQPSR
jgi:ketosteroid isomerase-like protein